jgi:hypothetical protein
MSGGKKSFAKIGRRSVSAVMYCASMVLTAHCKTHRTAISDRPPAKLRNQCTQYETGERCVTPAGIRGRFEALTRHEER